MSKAIVIVVVLGLILYGMSETMGMYKVKGDLEKKVDGFLDAVSETTMPAVKKDVAAAAQKLGVTVSADDVHIAYEDTDIQSVAQKLVGGKLGTQFTNKRVTIDFNYVARVIGIPFSHRIEVSRIRQVAAPKLAPSRAAQEVLDTP